MKNLIGIILSTSLLFSACVQQEKTEQTWKSNKLNAVVWYQMSAEAKALYHQGFNIAAAKLETHIQNTSSEKKVAVVVDIDETMLDNSPYEVMNMKLNRTYTRETWQEWTSLAQADALPGALHFANFVKQQGAEIFYISNRRLSELEATIKNLKKLGFPNASEEFVLLREESSSKKERRNLLSKDYEIVLLLGDNLGDFSEVFEDRHDNYGFGVVEEYKALFGDKFIVFPNPIYGAWETAIKPSEDKNEKSILNRLRGY